MYELVISTKFKKDLKKVKKDPLNDALTRAILKILMEKGAAGIPVNMKPYRLSVDYKNSWECHVRPDLLIIWFQIEHPQTIKLIRIGSHSDLF